MIVIGSMDYDLKQIIANREEIRKLVEGGAENE